MPEPIRNHVPTAEQDQRLELAIATLLRIGVVLAALLVLAGGVLALRHPGAPAPSYATFEAPGNTAATTSQHHPVHSIAGVFRDLQHLSGRPIIALGLLVLIATPIARVIFAIVGFARERDGLYTAISVIVLAILLFSLIHGT